MFTLWYLFRVYYFNVYIPRKNFMKERRNACFGVAQVKGNSWNVFLFQEYLILLSQNMKKNVMNIILKWVFF